MIMNLIELEKAIARWSHDRGILSNSTATTQTLKMVSEVGELCDNLAKGKCIKDDIGDVFVTLINVTRLSGYTIEECVTHAYDDIKDRKGFLNENGTFVKSTEPGYEQLVMEFNNRATA